MSVLRFISRDIVNSLGYEVRRVPSSEDICINSINGCDPITYEYMPRARGTAIFDIKVGDARGLNCLGLRFAPKFHPFVDAAMAMRERGSEAESLKAGEKVLSAFYNMVTPSSALEAVGLEEDDAPGLKGVPAAGWMFPWADKSTAEALQGRRTAMRLDALQYGRMLHHSEGITGFGPVGTGKLSLEVTRLHALTGSVAERGFDRFNRKSPLKVIGLRRNNEYRWLVSAGHHRFAVCAAFLIPSVPAIVAEIVRSDDCDYWPQVVSGTYSARGARHLFDRLYEGVPAPVCKNWLRQVQDLGHDV